jgi:Dockerin type I domain/NHL repeat
MSRLAAFTAGHRSDHVVVIRSATTATVPCRKVLGAPAAHRYPRGRLFAASYAGALALIAFLACAAPARAQSLTFTHFAGSTGGGDSIDASGSAARFNSPGAVAVDGSGNVYVADTNNNTIRKITPAGVVRTLAGTAGLSGSADGTGSAARFKSPSGVAVDGSGNVYVADSYNHTIRKITPAGVVTTLAGTAGWQGSADGTGSAARFRYPSGVAVDGSGNVYVADSLNHTIRKITPAGVVTTLAGTALSSGSADGTGSAARFNSPRGVAVDGSGNVYVADFYNHTIRKITPAGVVTTFAGTAGSVGSADGTGSAARFGNLTGVAVDGSGNVYVADTFSYTIRTITPAGVVTTLAGGSWGSADGTGSAARFDNPSGVAVDGSGNVYVADGGTIRTITPAGVVTTLAGTAPVAASADGSGSAARFSIPYGVAVDGSGNVYVGDTNNETIRTITPAGVVTTLAGTAPVAASADGTGSAARFYYPSGVAVDGSGNVYVADEGNNTIRKITPAGVVTTLAGTAGSSGSADGTGSAARFYYPSGVAVDGSGNVYVADELNHTIRTITPAGVVTTLAGTALSYGSADGTGSAARFRYPSGVAVDGSGNVYVADEGNSTIRKITPAGVVTTLAGTAGSGGSADGTGSAARFSNPWGVAVDGSGNVYVADTYNSTIRTITPAGVVTTLAGTAPVAGSADGTGSAARFNRPFGVAVDGSGNVYVADTYNHAIRKSVPAIADAATIDAASSAIGITRVLGTAPRTATAWEWTLIRRPPGSTAELSSTSVENPTFTPDVADLFVFRLMASSSAGARISTVSLSAMSLTISLTPAAASIAVAGTATETVTLSATQPNPVTVNLTSSNVAAATVPASVTIPAGATTATFTITGVAPGSSTITGTLSAALGGGTATATATVSALTLTLTAGTGGATAPVGGTRTFTVTLSAAQGTATTITLSSSNTAVTTVPASVTIPAGSTSATFTVTSTGVGSANITASALGSTSILAFAASAVTCTLAPATFNVSPGTPTVVTITLSQAQPGATTVTLASSDPSVTVPASVTIPAGVASTTFNATTTVTTGTATITDTLPAALGGGSCTATATATLGAPAGDANGDGSVTVGDVFYLINSLFAGGPAPIGSGDANGDGSVTVGDVFYLINYLFAGGPAPH